MGPDEFISVTADLVRRLGSANAALVWARINFVCQIPGADRVEDETGRWWVASVAKLSDDIGLSPKAIRRTIDNLIEAGQLEAQMVDASSWDRSLAYRTVGDISTGRAHWPIRSNASAQTGECISPNGQIDEPKRANVPYIEEVKKKKVIEDDPNFDEWWKHYPRKVKKIEAKKLYNKALKITDAQTLLAACIAFSKQVADREAKFIPHPTSWLNQGCWEDEGVKPLSQEDQLDWLRECWKNADTKSVEERSGLTYRAPDVSPDEDESITDFNRRMRQQWIDANRDEIIRRVMAKNASAA